MVVLVLIGSMESFWGTKAFLCAVSRHRHSHCSFAQYCMFCKVFCGTLSLSSVGEHWSPRCEPESPELQGKVQGKGRTSVQGEHLQLHGVTDALQAGAAHQQQLAVPTCSQANRVFEASSLKQRLSQAGHGAVCSPGTTFPDVPGSSA